MEILTAARQHRERDLHFRGAHASQPSPESKAFPHHFGKVTVPEAWWLKIFMGYHGFPTACQNLVDDGQSSACHIPCLCTAESDWQPPRTSDKLRDLLLYHLVLGFFQLPNIIGLFSNYKCHFLFFFFL